MATKKKRTPNTQNDSWVVISAGRLASGCVNIANDANNKQLLGKQTDLRRNRKKSSAVVIQINCSWT